jgi:hypothetical protein
MELDNSALLRRLHQDLLMMEGGVIVPGAMMQIVFENQGMGEGQGEAAIGAPGAMLHIAVDDQEMDDQEMEDNGQEDGQEA